MNTSAKISSSLARIAVPLIALSLGVLIFITDSNRSLFIYLNHAGIQWGGATFWSALTLLGNTLVAYAALLFFAGRRPEIIWSAFLAIIPASILVHAGKALFSIPRPPATLVADAFNLVGIAASNGSFPSGHTTTAFTLGGIICLNQKLRIEVRVAVFLVATMVGLSRVMVGIHWPLDVLTGAVIGWIAALLAVRSAQFWRWGITGKGQQILVCLLILAAITIFIRNEAAYPDAIWFQHLVAGAGLVALATRFRTIFNTPN